MRKFQYINSGQISCEAIHPDILNVPVELAVNFTGSRNAIHVYVAAKLIVMRDSRSRNVTLRSLCSEVRMSEKTVKRAISELEESGFVRQVQRWNYVPHHPDAPTTTYVGNRPDINESDGALIRDKDMYIFLESPWREYDEDGEEA